MKKITYRELCFSAIHLFFGLSLGLFIPIDDWGGKYFIIGCLWIVYALIIFLTYRYVSIEPISKK